MRVKSEDNNYLAVYGALKMAETNHLLFLRGAELVCTTSTRKSYVLYTDGIRSFLKKPQRGDLSYPVDVEVYKVSMNLLHGLDACLKISPAFVREMAKLQRNPANVRQAWIYRYAAPIYEESLFPHGNWSSLEYQRLRGNIGPADNVPLLTLQ